MNRPTIIRIVGGAALTVGLLFGAPAMASAEELGAPAPVVEPAVDPAPAPDPVEDPATEPAPEPGTDPVEDPATEPAPEPGTDPVEDPATEPTPEDPAPADLPPSTPDVMLKDITDKFVGAEDFDVDPDPGTKWSVQRDNCVLTINFMTSIKKPTLLELWDDGLLIKSYDIISDPGKLVSVKYTINKPIGKVQDGYDFVLFDDDEKGNMGFGNIISAYEFYFDGWKTWIPRCAALAAGEDPGCDKSDEAAPAVPLKVKTGEGSATNMSLVFAGLVLAAGAFGVWRKR